LGSLALNQPSRLLGNDGAIHSLADVGLSPGEAQPLGDLFRAEADVALSRAARWLDEGL